MHDIAYRMPFEQSYRTLYPQLFLPAIAHALGAAATMWTGTTALMISRVHDDEEDGMTFQSHNPATGEFIGTYPEHDKAATNIRLQHAWEGWLHWSRTPLHERTAFLIRLADVWARGAEP